MDNIIFMDTGHESNILKKIDSYLRLEEEKENNEKKEKVYDSIWNHDRHKNLIGLRKEPQTKILSHYLKKKNNLMVHKKLIDRNDSYLCKYVLEPGEKIGPFIIKHYLINPQKILDNIEESLFHFTKNDNPIQLFNMMKYVKRYLSWPKINQIGNRSKFVNQLYYYYENMYSFNQKFPKVRIITNTEENYLIRSSTGEIYLLNTIKKKILTLPKKEKVLELFVNYKGGISKINPYDRVIFKEYKTKCSKLNYPSYTKMSDFTNALRAYSLQK